MKRTKTMLVTLAATAAMTVSMATTAFAAPALPDISALLPTAGKNCPKSQQLTDLANQNSIKLPTNLPAAGSNPTNCPKANALQQLLGQYGINLPTTGTAPAATQAPVATPAPAATQAPAAPAATPAPKAAPAPANGGTTSGSMTADEQKMINLVNQDRAANGLPALTFDATLRPGALAHSQDMSENNYFSHTSPTQGDFTARIRSAGVKYTSAGENIAQYGSVEAAETGFMNSPGHRANILGNFTRVGIGIVYNQSKGAYFITQWFAK